MGATKKAGTKKAARKAVTPRRRRPKKPTAAATLKEFREEARVVSVFGAFSSRVLIELPAAVALRAIDQPLQNLRRTNVIEAVERDLQAIRELAPEVADSAVAATTVQLAYELEHPYNSATSKSMCARSLIQAIEHLLELVPEGEGKEDDPLAQLAQRLNAKRGGGSETAD